MKIAEKWHIPPPVLEYGLEHLGWSLWFDNCLEMMGYEADQQEFEMSKLRRQRERG